MVAKLSKCNLTYRGNSFGHSPVIIHRRIYGRQYGDWIKRVCYIPPTNAALGMVYEDLNSKRIVECTCTFIDHVMIIM